MAYRARRLAPSSGRSVRAVDAVLSRNGLCPQREMGVCACSGTEKDQQARADAEARAEAERRRVVEDSRELSLRLLTIQHGEQRVTCWELETAGELLKRLAEELRVPERRRAELVLVFAHADVPDSATLAAAGLDDNAEIEIKDLDKIMTEEEQAAKADIFQAAKDGNVALIERALWAFSASVLEKDEVGA